MNGLGTEKSESLEFLDATIRPSEAHQTLELACADFHDADPSSDISTVHSYVKMQASPDTPDWGSTRGCRCIWICAITRYQGIAGRYRTAMYDSAGVLLLNDKNSY